MRIAVFGLGYVGTVTGACLARLGHIACGVDISPAKVRMINDGRSPVIEEGMERLVAQAVRDRKFRAVLHASEAVESSDVSFVCVGTPSRRDGEANLDFVLRAVGEIGRALRSTNRLHTVAVRSTVPPGSMEEVVIPELERKAGKKVGRGFDVCFLPEFLREGSSIDDFFHPAKIVIGRQGHVGATRLLHLWRPIKAPRFVTSFRVAEMLKYVDNAFHALKVTFANEVGALCKKRGVDSYEVMEIFLRDRKLNISPLYLKPGYAFGGPCLPKDLRALCWMGRKSGLETPLLTGILESNRAHLQRVTELVLDTRKKRIGVLGLVFKSGTDDLRESPACALVKNLVEAGREVRVYDPRVNLEQLVGANRAFVESELPELRRLLVPSLGELVGPSEVIVVAANHPKLETGLAKSLRRGQIVVDLVRLPRSAIPTRAVYMGICW